VEQWLIAALAGWVLWAEVRAVLTERRHASERRDLCARLQAGSIERYDAHRARTAAQPAAARPRTPAAPEVRPSSAESVADAKLQFDRLMEATEAQTS